MPARRIRAPPRSRRTASVSSATIRPRFSIAAAMTSDLPAAPAQISATCMPGLASHNKAASCDPSSWISNRPERNSDKSSVRVRRTRRMPSGDNRVGWHLMPRPASLSRTTRRSFTFSRFIRISVAASPCMAASSSSLSGPRAASTSANNSSGHSSQTARGIASLSTG